MAAKSQSKQRVRKLNIKQKRKVVKSSKLTGSFRLFGRAVSLAVRNWKFFGGILLIYGLVYLVLVRGFAANFNLDETRQALTDATEAGTNNLQLASSLFGALVTTAGTTAGEAASVYQAMLFIVVSLVIIWGLRQVYGNVQKPKIRQAFYAGPAQIIPYLLVLAVVVLQMLPALLGVTVYGIVVSNGIAVGWLEQVLWLLITLGLVAVTVFFVSSSLFASYIATLPNMTPLRALSSARNLVRLRRFTVIRKVLFLPLAIGLIMALIFFPLVLIAPVAAEVLFLIFMLILLLISHTYFYLLYRELM